MSPGRQPRAGLGRRRPAVRPRCQRAVPTRTEGRELTQPVVAGSGRHLRNPKNRKGLGLSEPGRVGRPPHPGETRPVQVLLVPWQESQQLVLGAADKLEPGTRRRWVGELCWVDGHSNRRQLGKSKVFSLLRLPPPSGPSCWGLLATQKYGLQRPSRSTEEGGCEPARTASYRACSTPCSLP